MKSFTKKQKKKFSFKEKITIAVLSVIITGANVVTISWAATTWAPDSNLVSIEPTQPLVCDPGFKCGDKNGKKVHIGFLPNAEIMKTYGFGIDYFMNSNDPRAISVLRDLLGGDACALGTARIDAFKPVDNNVLTPSQCWLVKYTCLSHCEPFDSQGRSNSVSCSTTLCRDVVMPPLDPNAKVAPTLNKPIPAAE